MKKTFIFIASALFAIYTLTGCYSYHYGTAFSQPNAVNKDEAHGESSSVVLFQLIGGQSGSLKEAAQDGRIDTIYRVEYEKSVVLGGFITIWTTHVYGSLSKDATTGNSQKNINKSANQSKKKNSNVKKIDNVALTTSQPIQIPSNLKDNAVQITNVPKSNHFYVLSHKDVRIYVDGKYVGAPNKTYPSMKPGNHKIELKAENYNIIEQSINVTGSDSITINATIIPLSTKAAFPGGETALNEYIVENSYLSNASGKGKVEVSFVVEKNGEIKNIEITKSVNRSVDGRVIEMVRSMPNWEPATINGNKVSSYKSLSISVQ